MESKFISIIWPFLERILPDFIISKENMILNNFHDSVTYVHNEKGMASKQYAYWCRFCALICVQNTKNMNTGKCIIMKKFHIVKQEKSVCQ